MSGRLQLLNVARLVRDFLRRSRVVAGLRVGRLAFVPVVLAGFRVRHGLVDALGRVQVFRFAWSLRLQVVPLDPVARVPKQRIEPRAGVAANDAPQL